MALFTRFANDGNLHSFRSSDDGMAIRNCGGEDITTTMGSTNTNSLSTLSSSSASSTTPSIIYCKRCREKKAICKLREENLCQICSLNFISGRCRKVLTEPITSGRDILLAVGGGDASIVAMHSISLLMDCGLRRRRFLQDAAIIYVDTSSLYTSLPSPTSSSSSTTDNARYERVSFITRLALSLGLNIYIVPIETYFLNKLYILPIAASKIDNDGHTYQTNKEKLKKIDEETNLNTDTLTELPSSSETTNTPTTTTTSKPNDTAQRDAIRQQKKKEKKSQTTDTLLTNTLINRIPSTYIDQQTKLVKDTLQSLHTSSPSIFTSAIDQLQLCIKQCKQNMDQKQELIDLLIHNLIYRTTSALQYSTLITCDSADRVAQRVMLTTFSGEGFSLPMDIASLDTRFYTGIQYLSSDHRNIESLLPITNDNQSIRLPSNWYTTTAGVEKIEPFLLPDNEQQKLVQQLGNTSSIIIINGPNPTVRNDFLILRPFAEMEQKEFSIYRRYLRHILDITTPINAQPSNFTAGALPRTSIAHTTQGVLVGLQNSFPSTVHNVVRTVRKLRIPSFFKDDNNNQYVTGLCTICYGLLSSPVSSSTNKTLCVRCQHLCKDIPALTLNN